MIYDISGFQSNALGFFGDALRASKGKEGREKKAKAKALGALSCTSTRAQFVLYVLCSSKFSYKEKQTNQKTPMLKKSFNLIYEFAKLWWTGLSNLTLPLRFNFGLF